MCQPDEEVLDQFIDDIWADDSSNFCRIMEFEPPNFDINTPE